jgi:hypothetical protein
MYSLDIWDFYLSETLETGCPYDLDIALAEHDEHLNDAELKQRSKCISAVYDDISICLPDFFNEIVSVRIFFLIGSFMNYFSRKCRIHYHIQMVNHGKHIGIKLKNLKEKKHR